MFTRPYKVVQRDLKPWARLAMWGLVAIGAATIAVLLCWQGYEHEQRRQAGERAYARFLSALEDEAPFGKILKLQREAQKHGMGPVTVSISPPQVVTRQDSVEGVTLDLRFKSLPPEIVAVRGYRGIPDWADEAIGKVRPLVAWSPIGWSHLNWLWLAMWAAFAAWRRYRPVLAELLLASAAGIALVGFVGGWAWPAAGGPAIAVNTDQLQGTLLSLMAGALAIRVVRTGLLRRRPAHPQCEECGYNLTGNVSGRCPECGRAVPEELLLAAAASDEEGPASKGQE